MKKVILFLILLSCFYRVTGQEKPIFLGSKTIRDNEAVYPTEIVSWKYKGYYFIEYTTLTARPFPDYVIKKGSKEIKNSELFSTDMEKWVNKKIIEQYYKDIEDSPECYPEVICGVPPIDINVLGIYVDEKNMYFMILWSNNHYAMLEGKTNCNMIYSTTIVEVPITEISRYIKQ